MSDPNPSSLPFDDNLPGGTPNVSDEPMSFPTDPDTTPTPDIPMPTDPEIEEPTDPPIESPSLAVLRGYTTRYATPFSLQGFKNPLFPM